MRVVVAGSKGTLRKPQQKINGKGVVMQTGLGLATACATLLSLWVCSAENNDKELPPGVAYLQHAEGGKGLENFIEEAMRESALFRRRLLRGQERDFIDVERLAGALEQFCVKAPARRR